MFCVRLDIVTALLYTHRMDDSNDTERLRRERSAAASLLTKGIPKSEEHKARIAAGQRAAWAKRKAAKERAEARDDVD